MKRATGTSGHQFGFTLIELMIVVAIIGILAAIAVPQYLSFVVRAKMVEGMVLASAAKLAVVNAYQDAGGTAGIAGMRAAFNGTSTPSKYVSSVHITTDAGQITITYLGTSANGLSAINGNTLVLTPSIGGAVLAQQSGTIDWACGSASTATAAARGLPVVAGTLSAQYAPTECK